MQLYINEAEDFGLAFNTMTRMMCRDRNRELLELTKRTLAEYLPYFSPRTLVCAIRDLRPEGDPWNPEIPEDQKEEYEEILKLLVKQYLTLKNQKPYSDFQRQNNLRNIANECYLVPGAYDRAWFSSMDDFVKWVEENQLQEPAEYIKDCYDKPIPIRQECLKDFGEVCFWMIKYSIGRLSYMPYATMTFVKANIKLLDQEVMQNMKKCLEANGGNDEVWINLIATLNAEIQTR